MKIVPMTSAHWPEVARIYKEGIDTGEATFAEAPPASWEAFHSGKVAGCSLVALDTEGRVRGWAALSPISSRDVYAGVAELSIYVAGDSRGRGVGAALIEATILVSETRGLWTLQSGTFPENAASLALQQGHGFRVVGRRERMGRMRHGPRAGTWRDVLLLERRSPTVGRTGA